MEQHEFLDQHIFSNLKATTREVDAETIHLFSEADFEIVLERIQYFGISVYSIEPYFEDKSFGVQTNVDLKKKATDANWYGKAFTTFKHRQPGMVYSASYKVPVKLLARYS